MKTITVSLILTSACFPQLALAEGPDRPNQRHDQQHRPFGDAWKQADTNGDGVISRAEFDQMPRLSKLPEEKRDNLFKRLDKDGDGQMDHGDMRKIRGKEQHRDGPMPRIWELDKDKSGGVSFEEFKEGRMFQKLEPERQKAIFSRLDEDGDGVVTPQDRPKRPNSRPNDKPRDRMPPGAFLEKMDSNKDGSVSFDEFQAIPRLKDSSLEEKQRRFNAVDKNNDGKLTKEDFAHLKDRERKRPEQDQRRERPQKNPDSKLE